MSTVDGADHGLWAVSIYGDCQKPGAVIVVHRLIVQQTKCC